MSERDHCFSITSRRQRRIYRHVSVMTRTQNPVQSSCQTQNFSRVLCSTKEGAGGRCRTRWKTVETFISEKTANSTSSTQTVPPVLLQVSLDAIGESPTRKLPDSHISTIRGGSHQSVQQVSVDLRVQDMKRGRREGNEKRVKKQMMPTWCNNGVTLLKWLQKKQPSR